eukprot:14945547-Alexandrium_andersonii.AAC.1
MLIKIAGGRKGSCNNNPVLPTDSPQPELETWIEIVAAGNSVAIEVGGVDSLQHWAEMSKKG